tara:strand:+ start:738 stop:881 length:144 start_codon:yes stop_codon:yes gene_type:complete
LIEEITEREIYIQYIKENVYFFTDQELEHFVDFIMTKDIDRRGRIKN